MPSKKKEDINFPVDAFWKNPKRSENGFIEKKTLGKSGYQVKNLETTSFPNKKKRRRDEFSTSSLMKNSKGKKNREKNMFNQRIYG